MILLKYVAEQALKPARAMSDWPDQPGSNLKYFKEAPKGGSFHAKAYTEHEMNESVRELKMCRRDAGQCQHRESKKGHKICAQTK